MIGGIKKAFHALWQTFRGGAVAFASWFHSLLENMSFGDSIAFITWMVGGILVFVYDGREIIGTVLMVVSLFIMAWVTKE